MNNSEKPKSTNQTTEGEGGNRHNEALYDRFVEKTKVLFELGQEKSEQAWEKAMEVTREQMAAAGEFSAEQGEVFKRYLQHDLENTVVDMRKVGVTAKDRLNPSRLGAGALSSLAKLLHATGGALMSLSEKTEEALQYRTGDITTAGTLTCTACGHSIQLKQTSNVQACANCQNTTFRKSY